MNKLIKKDITQTKMFQGTFRFINNFRVLNDGGELQNRKF